MLENIRLSFQGIWSHKMRSFLTMLGIIIGIAAIISIVSTIKGTNEQIKQNLVGSGNNTVDVSLYKGTIEYQIEYYGVPEGITPITDETMDEIAKIDSVESASRYVSRDYLESTYYKETSLDSAQIYGIDMNYFDTCGYIVNNGRTFTQKDYTEFHKNVILNESAAHALFQNRNPIGETIEIKGEPFVVIGVVEKSSNFQPVINSIEDYQNYVGNDTAILYVPLNEWPALYAYDEPENVVIRATSTDTMSKAGSKTADVLNSTIISTGTSAFTDPSADNVDGEGIDSEGVDASGADSSAKVAYKASDLTEKAKNLQELSQATNNQLIWIASISLLVGGIGVMNIMLVSVTERTREIGLKKAIGARNSRIMGQFLTEAAILTSMGGIIGVIAGIILAQVISKISSTPVAISIPAIIFSVVFSMAIGIIFGLMPSIKAAKLNPIEALRHE